MIFKKLITSGVILLNLLFSLQVYASSELDGDNLVEYIREQKNGLMVRVLGYTVEYEIEKIDSFRTGSKKHGFYFYHPGEKVEAVVFCINNNDGLFRKYQHQLPFKISLQSNMCTGYSDWPEGNGCQARDGDYHIYIRNKNNPDYLIVSKGGAIPPASFLQPGDKTPSDPVTSPKEDENDNTSRSNNNSSAQDLCTFFKKAMESAPLMFTAITGEEKAEDESGLLEGNAYHTLIKPEGAQHSVYINAIRSHKGEMKYADCIEVTFNSFGSEQEGKDALYKIREQLELGCEGNGFGLLSTSIDHKHFGRSFILAQNDLIPREYNQRLGIYLYLDKKMKLEPGNNHFVYLLKLDIQLFDE